jgi:NAD(P)-dependent dehydrogenase (short-subunit alcohol dehydrogenase family)
LKTVLITGASSGIGKAIGEFLQQQGCNVIGTSRNPEKAASPFPLIRLDVRDGESIKAAVAETVSRFGQIDVLVNNAGVGIIGPLEELPIDEIRNQFETNLYGPIRMMQAVLPHMRTQKSGLIVNITSIAGYMGLPFRAAYSASKGALGLVTESIAMEARAFGVDVCSIAPGEFATNIAASRFHAPRSESSAYATTYGKTLDLINAQVDVGEDPLLMAKTVWLIMNSKNRKINYKAGPLLSRFSIVLKRILPDRVYEKMLMRHYGM